MAIERQQTNSSGIGRLSSVGGRDSGRERVSRLQRMRGGASLPGRCSAFTMIELLAVLVIAAVLVGLSVPTLERLMNGGGVGAAAREVSNMLGYARQIAITQRIYARVVFPCKSTNIHSEMWYRSYAIMTNRDNSAATTWAYVTKWEYLPPGTFFFGGDSSTQIMAPVPDSGTGSLDDSSSLNVGNTGTGGGRMFFPYTGVGLGRQLAYIEFGPTGAATALSPGSGGGTLAITEGIVNVNASASPPIRLIPSSTTTNTANPKLANVTTISVDSLIGRIQVTR